MLYTEDWTVVVVEDEEDSAQVVSQILKYHGIEVFVAHNGWECLKTLSLIKPTLVVMDLAMPEMDGWQTLAHLRDNPVTSELPVVAVTSYHSANVAEDALAAGFDAYFAKPVAAGSFVNALENIMVAR